MSVNFGSSQNGTMRILSSGAHPRADEKLDWQQPDSLPLGARNKLTSERQTEFGRRHTTHRCATTNLCFYYRSPRPVNNETARFAIGSGRIRTFEGRATRFT